ncbi:ornithine cyclodeaminase family protein [Variovorax sp. M-6]|uniref:ornithine cyclodeaminase family protein n=1 Tax=Variovorax sp. M-6 TaxID=3233041 RepID=UPI003F9BD79F
MKHDAHPASAEPVRLDDQLHYFDAASVRERLRAADCVEAMREVLIAVSVGRVAQPPRVIAALPDGGGMALMPGALLDAPWAGAKVIGRFVPQGVGGSQPAHRRAGVFLLFDRECGSLRAIVDAASLTNLRTAAVTLAATHALARPGPRTVALLGTGGLAQSHAQAFGQDPATRELLIWGRDHGRAQAFADRMGGACAVPLRAVARVEEAVARADVVCTLAGSAQPFVEGAWLRAGQHINVVGGSTAHEREVDAEAILRSRVFVDQRAQAAHAAGELLHAQAQRLIDPAHVFTEIGEVMSGRTAGRTQASEITLFKSLGLFAEDCAAASLLLRPLL